MGKKGIWAVFIILFVRSIMSAQGTLDKITDNTFMMAPIVKMSAIENDDSRYTVVTRNGVGILTDNSGFNLRQWGTEDIVLDAKAIYDTSTSKTYLYYAENPNGYTGVYRINLNTGKRLSFFMDNIIAFVPYDENHGDTRLYIINNNGDIYRLDNLFHSSLVNTGNSIIADANNIILKCPNDQEIFYYSPKNTSNNFYSIDARTSAGRDKSVVIHKSSVVTDNVVDAVFGRYQTSIDNFPVLMVLDDIKNLKIYSISVGNTDFVYVASLDYSGYSDGENGKFVTTTPDAPYYAWIGVPQNGKIIQVHFNDDVNSTVDYTTISDNPFKGIYANKNYLFVYYQNEPMHVYSLPFNSSTDQPIDYSTNVNDIRAIKTKNYYVVYSDIGTGILLYNIDRLNDPTNYMEVFTIFTNGIENPLLNVIGSFSVAGDPATGNNFATKGLNHLDLSTAGESYLTQTNMAIKNPNKMNIFLVKENKIYFVDKNINGIIMADATYANTQTMYTFNNTIATLGKVVEDPVNNLFIGFYKDPGNYKYMFIYNWLSDTMKYEASPDENDISINNFSIDPNKKYLYGVGENATDKIYVFDYSYTTSPHYINTITDGGNNSILQIGTLSSGEVVYTISNGVAYQLNVLKIDSDGNISNTDSFEWPENKDGYVARFSIVDNYLLANLGGSRYQLYKYGSQSTAPDEKYDFLPYPNPTSSKINVTDLPEGTEIRIYNMNGVLIYKEEDITGGIFTLDLNNIDYNGNNFKLTTGKYIMYIKTKDMKDPILRYFYFVPMQELPITPGKK